VCSRWVGKFSLASRMHPKTLVSLEKVLPSVQEDRRSKVYNMYRCEAEGTTKIRKTLRCSRVLCLCRVARVGPRCGPICFLLWFAHSSSRFIPSSSSTPMKGLTLPPPSPSARPLSAMTFLQCHGRPVPRTPSGPARINNASWVAFSPGIPTM